MRPWFALYSMLLAVALLTSCGGESENVTAAKAKVVQGFFDPEAAKFTNVREVKIPRVSYVCGEVNGTNQFGGYVGSKKFFVANHREEGRFATIIQNGGETPCEAFDRTNGSAISVVGAAIARGQEETNRMSNDLGIRVR